jgi:hypothetical protein
MAAHLLEHGYWHPAASLTGAVLEDGLGRIAQSNDVVVKNGDDINALNQRCLQKPIYSRLVQQRIQTWNTIRNSADHGKFGEYTEADVKDMHSGVRSFLADYLR